MGHNVTIPLGFRPSTLTDAYRIGEPVNVYCLDCAKHRQVSAWTLYQKVGELQLGQLYGGFWCRTCRRSSVAVVFPCDITTPRAWADRRGKPKTIYPKIGTLLPGENLPYRIDRWDEHGNVAAVILRAMDADIAIKCFPVVRARYPEQVQLTVREGMQFYDVPGSAKR